MKDISQLRICSTSHDFTNNKIKSGGLSAAFYTEKIWDKGTTLRIKFLDENPSIPRTPINQMNTTNGPIDPLQDYFSKNPNIPLTDAIKKIVKERIEPFVKNNLKFEFVDKNSDSDIRISFDSSGGAWSKLGTDAKNTPKDQATMNLGWFDVATVIHEFGHLLGMIHEHQNPRGKTIDWNDKKVFEWAESTQGWDKQKTKTNIIDRYDINSINGSNFDPLSIMLYFFPADLTNNNIGTNQNLRLSGYDAEFIAKNYGENLDEANDNFEKMYNTSILTNISKSTQLANQKGTKSTLNIVLISIGIIITILFIVFLIHHFLIKRK